MEGKEAISTFTEKLPVKLTPEELTKYGGRLADLEGDLAAHNCEMKSTQSTMAARKKELESQIFQLASVMRDKKELREVSVDVYLDGGEALDIRRDTQECVRRRPMRADESQQQLFEPDEPDEDDGEPKAEA